MSKYKKLFNEMLNLHAELFAQFRLLHDAIPRNQNEFNRVGEEVLEIIRVYIDDLCRTSEGSGYGNYTSKLSDMFWKEVRAEFPDIDDIGIE